ncbi:MAG TPA: hypothetical protein VJ204_18755 [Solirubrobacterales bacterium]|nr:hypothetical protein [Solirubrobacterales bacterium]
MKILLTDPAAVPDPTTLVATLGGSGAPLRTLAGERVGRAFVAESDWSVVCDVVHRVRVHVGSEDEEIRAEASMRIDVRCMARLLLGFEDGSSVLQRSGDSHRLAPDYSEATPVDRVLPSDTA